MRCRRAGSAGRPICPVLIDEFADGHLADPLIESLAGQAPHRSKGTRAGLVELCQPHGGEPLDPGNRAQVGGEATGGLIDGRLAGDVERGGTGGTGGSVGARGRARRDTQRTVRFSERGIDLLLRLEFEAAGPKRRP